MTSRWDTHMASDLGIVREKIASARSLAVLTGAGISADSGVPTFEVPMACGGTFGRKISPRPRPLSAIPDWCGNGTTGVAN